MDPAMVPLLSSLVAVNTCRISPQLAKGPIVGSRVRVSRVVVDNVQSTPMTNTVSSSTL
jgi:hypothetical protein